MDGAPLPIIPGNVPPLQVGTIGACAREAEVWGLGPDTCHQASAQPLGLSPSHVMAGKAMAMRHYHFPLHPPQAAAASGCWWQFLVGFVSRFFAYWKKVRHEPLLLEWRLPGPNTSKSFAVPFMAEESGSVFALPRHPFSSTHQWEVLSSPNCCQAGSQTHIWNELYHD